MDRNTPSPSCRPLDELEAEITELAGHLNAAQHRWLLLVAEFDRRKGWSDGACQSCAHWLNWKCGVSLGAAREKVRVAHRLAELPKISAAMARGELSYSKVRALTRAASTETEDYLLSIAIHGTAYHVERLVQCYRRAQEAEELSREARQHAGRSVSFGYDEDGSLVLKARLPAEVGALLLKALDAAREEIPTPHVPAGTSRVNQPPELAPSHSTLRADAMAVLAQSFLKQGPAALSGGERHQIVVHVDAETLRDSTAGRCEIEHGPSLPAETVRRLGCDCSVVMMVENAQSESRNVGQGTPGDPLNVGRKTRSIPPALRRALNARDQGCRFPGCTHTRYVDSHHVRHWAQGGETKASNLVLLCSFHHRAVHEGGITVQVLDDGAFRFVRPDGRAFDSLRPVRAEPLNGTELPLQHRQGKLHIDPNTAVTRWRGERMDYGLAIEALLTKDRRAATRSRGNASPV